MEFSKVSFLEDFLVEASWQLQGGSSSLYIPNGDCILWGFTFLHEWKIVILTREWSQVSCFPFMKLHGKWNTRVQSLAQAEECLELDEKNTTMKLTSVNISLSSSVIWHEYLKWKVMTCQSQCKLLYRTHWWICSEEYSIALCKSKAL